MIESQAYHPSPKRKHLREKSGDDPLHSATTLKIVSSELMTGREKDENENEDNNTIPEQ